MIIDAMADAGVLMGLPRDLSLKLAAQTVMGSAVTVLESGEHPDVLKDKVCSPGGTTIEGVRVLEDYKVRAAFISAIQASVEKAHELGRR
jgi:pyrroline-5-carboxylate reductase